MRNYYNETVDSSTFYAIRNKVQWAYTMPIRKRYLKYIPQQAFAVSEDICLIVEGPKTIRLRKRWSLRSIKRKIRLVYIVNDGRGEPYMKIHLV